VQAPRDKKVVLYDQDQFFHRASIASIESFRMWSRAVLRRPKPAREAMSRALDDRQAGVSSRRVQWRGRHGISSSSAP
jgi:hypothetical protein